MFRSKMMLGLIASVAIATGTSQAALTISLSGLPAPSIILGPIGTSPNASLTYLNGTSNTPYAISATSNENPGKASSLQSTIQVTNNTAGLLSFSITVTENGYTFPPSAAFFASSYTASTNNAQGGTFGVSFQSNATGQLGQSFLGLGSGSAKQAYVPVSAPDSLTHIVTVSNLASGSTFTFGGLSVVASPAPPTAVAALAGMPLLGLVGFLRRRMSVK